MESIKDKIEKAKPTPNGGAEDGAPPAPPTEGCDPQEVVEFVVAIPGKDGANAETKTVKLSELKDTSKDIIEKITRDARTQLRAQIQFIPHTSSETGMLPPERLLAEISAKPATWGVAVATL